MNSRLNLKKYKLLLSIAKNSEIVEDQYFSTDQEAIVLACDVISVVRNLEYCGTITKGSYADFLVSLFTKLGLIEKFPEEILREQIMLSQQPPQMINCASYLNSVIEMPAGPFKNAIALFTLNIAYNTDMIADYPNEIEQLIGIVESTDDDIPRYDFRSPKYDV